VIMFVQNIERTDSGKGSNLDRSLDSLSFSLIHSKTFVVRRIFKCPNNK
jgi:hypothetical protein